MTIVVPHWTVIASCLAALILGYIVGWAIDEWQNHD
jgi:hypothetical protein